MGVLLIHFYHCIPLFCSVHTRKFLCEFHIFFRILQNEQFNLAANLSIKSGKY